jgi:hypothetical protein
MPNETDWVYVVTGFGLQIALVVFFALRRWDFGTAMELGSLVYALALPALLVSIWLLRSGAPWYQWIAGFLFAAWAVFGFVVDIARPVSWRSPLLWSVAGPYLILYLAAQMFYWWPLARIDRRLWLAYAALFVASTWLNAISHR